LVYTLKEELKQFVRSLTFPLVGDYDESRRFFLKKGELVDSCIDEYEVERKLVVGQVKGEDQSKNTIHPLGGSWALIIDGDTKEYVEPFNIKILRVINEVTKQRMVLLYCIEKGGEPTNE